MNRREFVLEIPAAMAAVRAAAGERQPIRRVDIIHHTHTDVGYTDLPSVCREMHKRFIDSALDLCLNDPRFRWTVESMLGLDDWWRATPARRHDEMLRLIAGGRMDVMALPFNQAPFQNAMQWDAALRWVSDDVWKAVNPRAAMQNDVNGFPRAGAIRLLNLGVGHLLMGINADSGGPPFRRPSAFWWKMPDGRRLFVWLGYHYGNAFSFFEPRNWIRSQPRWAATEFRPPNGADIHHLNETELRAAHKRFTEQIAKLQSEGYDYPALILSYTNQWRYDNDPPFPPLGAFVEAWNALKLEPPLRLTTATQAVQDMAKEVGARLPEFTGEWTDWWANGDASGPREVAASRVAKRSLIAAFSPAFGPMPASAQPSVAAILKDLCLFDEHTWGANESVSRPESLFTHGQYTEKCLLAYRPMAHADALLGLRARSLLDGAGEGIHIVNTSSTAFTGWASFAAATLRDEVAGLETAGGSRYALQKRPGGVARVWIQALGPASVLQLRPIAAKVEDAASISSPTIEKDSNGWPLAATWPGMSRPLFRGEMAHLIAAQFAPSFDRGSIARLHGTADAAARSRMRDAMLSFAPARYGGAEIGETAHTLVFTQAIEHPRIARALRTIEFWKVQPRARVTVRFDRLSSLRPEVLYLAFSLPVEGRMPVFSNGGVAFTPYRDQLRGSCSDYYAIDGWAQYAADGGHWLWVTRDAPLVSVGGPQTLARRTDPPEDTHRLLAMVFDNCWHTNFVADSHGTMEFQFDLAWSTNMERPGEVAESLCAEPVVLVNGPGRNAPELERNLFRP